MAGVNSSEFVSTIMTVDGVPTVIVADSTTSVVTEATQFQILSTGSQGPRGPAGSGSLFKIAGSSIGGQRIVVTSPTSNDQVLYGSNTTATHANLVLGITVNAASAGGTLEIVRSGEITESSWNWTLGAPIFLGTNGLMTQTAPVNPSALFSLVVAFPITPTKIYVSIREPIYLI
jgi:hypothetical protein